MSQPELHAKVVAHNGFLIFEMLSQKSIPDEVVTSVDVPHSPMQLVLDSAKYLGVSREALQLLFIVKPFGGKPLGDLQSFINDQNGQHVFGWPGTTNMIIRPADIQGHKYFISTPPHIAIENDVPEEAAAFIETLVA
ncbi:hypothetical protein RYA05_02655 [Pseudomonas syringae pv. actinidiae]|nr:hypothetical protein [Pseudomonas syringae pv. actinidiae]